MLGVGQEPDLCVDPAAEIADQVLQAERLYVGFAEEQGVEKDQEGETPGTMLGK